MFLALLAVTFLISLAVSALLARIFTGPMESILKRIIVEDISYAWLKYLKFVVYVVGISSGVRIWDLEKYITPPLGRDGDFRIILLNSDRWVFEVYRTIIGTLQGVAWMLLVFFVFALLAYVVTRRGEWKEKGMRG